jgi:hypothetical protein
MKQLLTDEKMHSFYNETMEQNSLNHPKDFGEKIRNFYEEKLSEKDKQLKLFQEIAEENGKEITELQIELSEKYKEIEMLKEPNLESS